MRDLRSPIRILCIIIVSSFLILSGIVYSAPSIKDTSEATQKIVSRLSKEIEIPPGSDYYIKFSSENLTLEEKTLPLIPRVYLKKLKML